MSASQWQRAEQEEASHGPAALHVQGPCESACTWRAKLRAGPSRCENTANIILDDNRKLQYSDYKLQYATW
jgi:hypothetical protein